MSSRAKVADEEDDNTALTLFVLGPGAVGKTSLTIRYLSGDFQEEYDPTIEEVYRKTVNIDGKISSLEIYVYNITSTNSFEDLQGQYEQLIKARSCVNEDAQPPPICLAGNKCDLDHLREVSKEDGEALGMLFIQYSQNRSYSFTLNMLIAKTWNCPFWETSAKDKINNEIIFEELVREIHKKAPKGNKKKSAENSGGCCTIL